MRYGLKRDSCCWVLQRVPCVLHEFRAKTSCLIFICFVSYSRLKPRAMKPSLCIWAQPIPTIRACLACLIFIEEKKRFFCYQGIFSKHNLKIIFYASDFLIRACLANMPYYFLLTLVCLLFSCFAKQAPNNFQ